MDENPIPFIKLKPRGSGLSTMEMERNRITLCRKCARSRGYYCETHKCSIKDITSDVDLRECYKMGRIN